MALRTQPAQRRSEERVEAILAAASTLYDDPAMGRERMTTTDISKASGCSIGTIYRYFDDIVAIFDEIRPNRNDSDNIVIAVREALASDVSGQEKLDAIAQIVG